VKIERTACTGSSSGSAELEKVGIRSADRLEDSRRACPSFMADIGLSRASQDIIAKRITAN
jgi:hypothetical protein